MPRADLSYWARLRKDAPSSWAAGLAVAAALAATLSIIGLVVIGAQTQARANPLYWLLMLPLVWWASGLAGFEPRPVKMLAGVTYSAPVITALCLAVAFTQGRDLTPWLVALLCAVPAAIGSRAAYARSLLRREGPAR